MRRVRRPERAPHSVLRRDILGWFLISAFVGACGLGVGAGVIHNGFAVLRIWFDGTSLGLAPLLCFIGLAGFRTRASFMAFACVVIGAAALGVALYATRVEPFRLEVTRHVVRSNRLPAGIEASITVAILADLQTDQIGAFEAEVFQAMDEAKPDLILLPGDYLQFLDRRKFDTVQPALAGLFRSMEHVSRLGIVAVDGDVDQAAVSLAGTGARCLTNETVRFDDDRLQVIGLGTSASRRDLSAEVVEEMEGFDGLTIICGHAPDYMNMVLEGRFDKHAVLVAGHTHGGQVAIPGFGPPLTLSSVPRWLAAGTLAQRGDTTLLVSRGVGMERKHAPRVRFNCRPQLVLLELVGSK